MAEAIGLAASIAGLVQLTGSVFKLVTKFCKEAKDAPSKAQELATQARELAGIFENLRLLASSLEARNSDCTLKTQHLHSCQQTLDEINNKLDKAQTDFDSGKPAKRFSRRLRWPFSLSETKDLVADLANHRDILHLALSADSMDALLKSLAKQDDLHNMIERKLSFDTRVQLDKRRKEIMNFFLRVNPQDYLEVSQELRHKATGSWLTSGHPTFSNWKDGTNSKLWLSGIPGYGKTVLCGLVVETVLEKSDDSTAVCYAFCDYKNPHSCLPENVVAALAVQLGLQGEEAFDVLEEYFDMLHPDDKLPAQPKLEDLLELVQYMAEVYDKVFLVVDGVDECGSHVSRMADSLKAMADKSENISVAIFSRKEEEIRERLEGEFEHIEVMAHTKDLEDYTLAEVSKRKVLKRMETTSPELYKDILDTLVQGAQGMFRWVACQIDHICDQPSNNARKRALRELPPTLNGTYDRVLNNIMSCHPEVRARIQKALHWIALGSPKLKVSALCEAVSIQKGMEAIAEDDVIEPEVISRHCGCLLRRSLDGNYFEFAHFTVLEYLEKVSIGEFRYSEELAYQSLAETSVRFLLFPCFDRVPTFSETVEKAYCDERAITHPFYPVAEWIPNHWLRSLCPYSARSMVLEKEPILSLLKRLFSPETGHFRAWLYPFFFYERNELTTVFSSSTLHIATCLLSPQLCSFALEQGADVNGLRNSETPLYLAIIQIRSESQETDESDSFWSNRHIKVFNLLLDHGADASFSVKGKSCLAHAFESLRGCTMVPFIRPSTPVPADAITAFLDRSWNDSSDDQLLHAVLELCGSNDAPPQWQPMAAPALFHSRRRGLSAPEQAIHLSANSYSNDDYPKALQFAIRAGLVEDLSTLIRDTRFKKYIEKYAFDLLIPLARMTLSSSGQMAEMLLDSGLDPAKVDFSRQTCLHFSCASGNMEVTQVFLDHGLSPACTDINNQNAWHMAATAGHTDILRLLCHTDESFLLGLATVAHKTWTPFGLALMNGHVQACLYLLEICPADRSYFRSDRPLLYHAAKTASRELFSAVLAKKGIDSATYKYGSTPIHHLDATCTPEFAEYLKTLYDPLCFDNSGSPPLKCFLRRWLEHNENIEVGKVNVLRTEMLQILIPDCFEFSTSNKRVHAWEIVCAALEGQELCCYPTNQPKSDGPNSKCYCEYHLGRYLQPIFRYGVLSSYETKTHSSGMEPLLRVLGKYNGEHFCARSIIMLIDEVMEASTIKMSSNTVENGFRLLENAIRKSGSGLVSKFIDYGLDIHRRPPKELSFDYRESLFETACRTTNSKTFEVILAGIPASDLSEKTPTGQTPLELVVQGTSSDKTSLIRALCSKGVNPRLAHSETPLILQAAEKEEWKVVQCLAELGDDIFARQSLDGWGLAEKAVFQNNLEMLKWFVQLVESIDRISQLQTRFTIDLLKKYEANSNLTHRWYDPECTLLHMASINHIILPYLLDQQVFSDINITSKLGRTPLHHAVDSSSWPCCQILIENGADLTIRDSYGRLPIDVAFDSGKKDLVELLIQAGSPTPFFYRPRDYASTTDQSSSIDLTASRRSSFEMSIRTGCLSRCKKAVQRGYSIHQPFSSCPTCTPLFIAIQSQQEDVIGWLLDQGASTLGVICNDITHEDIVIYAASVLQSPSCVGKVLSAVHKRQAIWHTNLSNSIYLAVQKEKPDVLAIILMHVQMHIKQYYDTWGHELDGTAQPNSVQRLKPMLLDCPINFTSSFKETALHCAARIGSLKMVETLLHHGANVDSEDDDLATPLIHAASKNHLPVVERLLAHGATVGARDIRGSTAMTWAILNGNFEMARLFDNIYGQSAVETFKDLISRGLRLDRCNQYGHPTLNFILSREPVRDYMVQTQSTPPMPAKKVVASRSLLELADINCVPSDIKRFFLSLSPMMAQKLMDQDDSTHGTPLCASVAINCLKSARLLLTLGASLEKPGSSFGTPVMCAIVFGRFEAVKMLVREGAKLNYTDEHGGNVSALTTSLPFPKITQWLLVGQYQDQQKLTNNPFYEDIPLRLWSGRRALKSTLLSRQERYWGESTLAFCTRFHRMRRQMIGQIVSGDLVWA
ncbi:ankyrin repeat-containing domain protein [Fusarium oxysporum Fo47]|uniref:ankyrin repeat-containing domain protein n=1 Tax=Fusarium oxysporum Fo47 TaxID=660027 RepID=UPI00286984A5|nr:ankyrin repeat-containing domain protein [Fusarium oxysporum Fo47]QKD56720.2 ankyrin repeat-containing domain protein [Fusarium oxysporum Fo47]